MAQRGRSDDIKTPPCRLGFDRFLFSPQEKTAQNGSKYNEWGATLIFDKSIDRSVLENAVRQAIIAEWGEKGLEQAKAGLIKSPFLDGAGKEARNKETGELHPGMGEGVFFIRTNTRQEPVVRYKSPNIPATPQEVYAGCHGFAVVNAYAWTSDSGKGVSFGLQYFQKLRDGDPLRSAGGPINVDKYFEKIDDTGAAPEETKSGQGAGGLFG